MRVGSGLVQIVIALLGVSLLFAPVSRADEFAALRQNAAKIQTLQADFIQKKNMKILAKPLVSEGRLWFSAPDSIRWEYTRPLRSIVISDAGVTRRFMVSGDKMVEDTSGGAAAMRLVLSEVAGWMTGQFEANPAFRATIKQDDALARITLTPLGSDMAGFLERIEIVISLKDAKVQSVRMIESADAETLIEFQRVRINDALPTGIFRNVP